MAGNGDSWYVLCSPFFPGSISWSCFLYCLYALIVKGEQVTPAPDGSFRERVTLQWHHSLGLSSSYLIDEFGRRTCPCVDQPLLSLLRTCLPTGSVFSLSLQAMRSTGQTLPGVDLCWSVPPGWAQFWGPILRRLHGYRYKAHSPILALSEK